MKKNSASRYSNLFSTTLVFSLISLQSFSQDLTASLGSPDRIHKVAYNSTNAPAEVNAKIMDSFKRFFAGAQSPVWEVLDNKYYAHFQSGDRQALAAFRKNGQIDYYVLYGTEKHLPAHEKSLVLANYTDFTITTTQYIVKNNVGTWLVTLESNKEIYKVKTNGEEVSVVERMRKVK
jgi:hypothetical protein